MMVAKWEESKKWQKMVDRLKGRLREREGEIDRLTRNGELTKNALDRSVSYLCLEISCFWVHFLTLNVMFMFINRVS